MVWVCVCVCVSSRGSTSLGVSHEAEEKLDIIQFASAIFVAEEGKVPRFRRFGS